MPSGNTVVIWIFRRAGSEVLTAWSAKKIRRATNDASGNARRICESSNDLRSFLNADDRNAHQASFVLQRLLHEKRELATEMPNGAGDVGPAECGDLAGPDGGNVFSNEPLTDEDLGSLDGNAFEAFCALLWTKMGHTRTIKTKRVGDGCVDVVAIKRNAGALIQCKSSTIEGRELGWEGGKE